MNYFMLNIFLATGWVMLTGHYDSGSLLMGFVIGYLTLWLTLPFVSETRYFTRFRAVFMLISVFTYELIMSTWRVVSDVLTVRHMSDPGIVRVPLDAKTDLEITILANMVSLTPGTLSLDVTPDKSHLIIHAMFAQDPDGIISGIKNGMERRLLEVIRG